MEIAEKHLDIPKMLDAEGEMKIVLTVLQKICRYYSYTPGDFVKLQLCYTCSIQFPPTDLIYIKYLLLESNWEKS